MHTSSQETCVLVTVWATFAPIKAMTERKVQQSETIVTRVERLEEVSHAMAVIAAVVVTEALHGHATVSW